MQTPTAGVFTGGQVQHGSDEELGAPCLLRRSSGKLEFQMESKDTPEQLMTPLKAAILQAHQGMAQLTSGKAATMNEISEKLKMDRSYLARTLQLANLAPDIVKLIWENRQPSTLTLDKLRKGIPGACSTPTLCVWNSLQANRICCIAIMWTKDTTIF